MKKYFSFALSFLILGSCTDNTGYVINGTVTDQDLGGQYVYLYEYKQEDSVLLDSAIIENNSFKFTGEQEKPALRVLTTNKAQNPAQKSTAINNAPFSTGFILENGTINVTLGKESYATGTPENDTLKKLEEKISNQNKELRDIVQQLNEAEEGAERDAIYEKGMGISTSLRETIKNYVKENTDKVSGAKLLADFTNMFTDDERLEMIDKADATFVEEPAVQPIVAYLNEIKPIAAGAKFTDFTMNDMQGNERKLSDYAGNGKVLIIDFWASWCGPCIAAMPELKRIYDEYKDQGLEVIGVSLDSSQEAWEKGTQNLDISWPQLSDLKGWNNEATQIYKVRSIPNLMVIGKDGTILARNLHGQALEDKIKEYL